MSARDDGLPEDAEGMNLMIHALVDGELDAAAALAVERRIAADPALGAEHARIVALQGAVARLPRAEVSDDFMARMAAIGSMGSAQATPAPAQAAPVQAEDVQGMPSALSGQTARRQNAQIRPSQARPAWRRFGSFEWRSLAASIVVTAVLASGATQWVMTSNAPDSFADAVAGGHRRSLLAASPFDIASSDRHTVKPWLDARIGVSPPAPDLAADGYALVGGRVEVIADRPVPALVYRHREHLITLVASPQDKGSATAPTDLSAGGFSMVRWSDGAFSYWAISDMERPELDDFAARFRAAAK
ncbi:anti-sigma factor [Mesorhizobium sp. PAMC28654]|uniref:anti-sigma factor family protein n=1 Tax=Mesorhizobium sp. PAMC28654 TaxID=2880934 RepID=UPI001D0B189A|nr:anti-sigma factor [Mesorhizobium sp. PAMC28654]UDL89135.1 anti-sigma factor [Mesorhizobium sp. PAMC28654]